MSLEIANNTVRDRAREVTTDMVEPAPDLQQPPRKLTESELALTTAQRSLTDARLQIAQLVDRNRLLQQRLHSLAGAETLHQAAKRVIACITACRHGDDELIVIPPEADAQDRCATAELRICALWAALSHSDGVEVTLTLSIGNTGFPAGTKDRSEMVTLADVVMYRARPAASLVSAERENVG